MSRSMSLADLVQGTGLGCKPIGRGREGETCVITSVTDDSRDASPGALFFARAGTVHDGTRFVDDAINAGAVAVIFDATASRTAETCASNHPSVFVLTANDVACAAAVLSHRFFGDPSLTMPVIGATGTNGKTTVTWLIHQIMKSRGTFGLCGSVAIDTGAESRSARLTTPGACELSHALARMRDAGARGAAIEVSSHALDQRRTDGIRFAGAVFTNLSGDHLDYHRTMDAYAAAKRRLFQRLEENAFAVINGDDPAADSMIAATRGPVFVTTLERRPTHASGVLDGSNDRVTLVRATWGSFGATARARTPVRFEGPWGTIRAALPLVGRHNISNVLQAVTCVHACGIDVATIKAGLAALTSPPGRLEPIDATDRDPQVFVDFAHTDDALENVLRALRPVTPDEGQLWIVFGCGGDRDHSKRPRMGAIARRLADRVVLTSDNPRTEDPDEILDQVEAGVRDGSLSGGDEAIHRDADRAAAITFAVRNATPHDIIVIAGKGHESTQIVGTERRPFRDQLVAANAIRARGFSMSSVDTETGGHP